MKPITFSLVALYAGAALLSSCASDTNHGVQEQEPGMRWGDGQRVKIAQTVELSNELLIQAPEGGTALAGFEAKSVAPTNFHLGIDVNFEIEYRDSQSITEKQGHIANARVVHGSDTIDLYDGSGGVDNIEVILAEGNIVWAELSDSDSAATWDWVVKSVPLAGGDPIQLARMDDFPQLMDADPSFQNFNMRILGDDVLWSPSIAVPEDAPNYLVLSAPLDGSRAASVVTERTRLVPGYGDMVAAQMQEPTATEAPEDMRPTNVFSVGASLSDPIFFVNNDAELIANVGDVLAFKSQDGFFLADTKHKQFTRIATQGSAPITVTTCGTNFVFDSVDEDQTSTTFLIDTADYSVSGEQSSTGVRCVLP